MKIIENTSTRLVVRSAPWIMGSIFAVAIVVLSGVSLTAFFAGDTEKALSAFITGPIFFGAGFAAFVRRDILTLDRATRTMEIRHSTVFRRSVEPLDFSRFERASTQTQYSASGSSNPLHRVALLMAGSNPKDVHNISPVYSGGPNAENAAKTINEWLQTANKTKAETTTDQIEFAVLMKKAGSSKIDVIKAVRRITGFGLKDAKNLVEAGGKIKEDVTKAEAEDIKAQLEAVGAEMELLPSGPL